MFLDKVASTHNSFYTNTMKKDFDLYILVFFGLIFAGLVAIGFITTVKKTFGTVPQHDTTEAKEHARSQKERMSEIRRRHDKLMRDQRQKMRDLKRLNSNR